MKVLLLNGSPHENGATFQALKYMQENLKAENIETELFSIGTDILPCRACYTCKTQHHCIIEDKVNIFTQKMQNMDGLIIASPVHYAAIASGLKCFLDRAFFSAPKSIFQNKPAASIAVCRRAGTIEALNQINKYFGISDMPIISGSYWNMVYGSTPDEQSQDLEGIQNLKNLATNFAFILKCMDCGFKNNILAPKANPLIRTNFIKK